MKISEFKNHLSTVSEVIFSLPDGSNVPSHYHITEVGFITKTYIDCGGTVREEKVANFQLWTAEDFDHRIQSEKILEIISKAEEEINLEDLEIEVEYQNETIGKYNLEFYDNKFISHKCTLINAEEYLNYYNEWNASFGKFLEAERIIFEEEEAKKEREREEQRKRYKL